MKSNLFLVFLILALLCFKSLSQDETNTTPTNGQTNGTTNGQTNGTTNGQTNNTTNGQTNNTTNQQKNNTNNNEQAAVQEIQCTKPCKQFQYRKCTLCSEMCKNLKTGEVTSYKLTTCQLRQCKKWIAEPKNQYDPTDTQVICAQPETKLLSQQQCGPQCCGQSFTAFTYENYEKCVLTDQQHVSFESNVAAIVGAVLSSVLGFIIILVLLICCRERISLCCQNMAWSIQNCFTKSKQKKPKEQMSTDQSQHQSSKKSVTKWETISSKKKMTQLPTTKYIIESQYQINPQIYCSVCLQTEPNTFTDCGHSYHLPCLRKKMAKKLLCPECNSKDFNPLKIRCDICENKSAKFTINKKNADVQLPSFLKNNKIYCDTCLTKSIRQGIFKGGKV